MAGTKTIASSRIRTATIVAQDPSVRLNGKILTASVDVPAEALAPGPWGYRVQVLDYDATADALYRPLGKRGKRLAQRNWNPDMLFDGPVTNSTIREDPRFHACNAYVVAMRTLGRFERALGRRVGWGFRGHQLKVVPHAFEDANAFYSHDDQALLLGYFRGQSGPIFTSLSHDVVAHECTHALVDGIRTRYNDPSSVDQAAFHEGFSDIVALLSVFALPEVVSAMLELSEQTRKHSPTPGRILAADVRSEMLRKGPLFGLAKELGAELSMIRGQALRQSVALVPSKEYLRLSEYQEAHRRGEILVAAIVNAFLEVWSARIVSLGSPDAKDYDLKRVVADGAEAADHLLTTCVRALDYCPPVHLEFGDFLCALITADQEIHPDDHKYGYRERIRQSFSAYGIDPPVGSDGVWSRPGEHGELDLDYARVHSESLTRDVDECFRFVFENRDALRLADGAHTFVQSLRPSVRIDWDGFMLRETVAEIVQMAVLHPSELRALGIKVPAKMSADTEVKIFGGCTLILDEAGRLKFNIHNRLHNRARQSARIQQLWEKGFFRDRKPPGFDALHRARARNTAELVEEAWL